MLSSNKAIHYAIQKLHNAILLYFTLALGAAQYTIADIVKPALVEISVYAEGHYRVELRASLEAIMTGINSSYRNTKDAPTSDAYDELRELRSAKLLEKFLPFRQKLIDNIELKFDGKPTPLEITDIQIPEPGYTKVPRISVIVFEGKIKRNVKQINWYYPASFSDNAVRVRQVDTENEKWHWSAWQWLRDDQPSKSFSLQEVFTQPPVTEVIADYTQAGFEHIIPKGLDHILFILGIFLLGTRLKPLAWQATMFTLAHSITLSLAMFEIVSLPPSIVEPLIALSIAYIAFENVFAHRLKVSRLALVFFFGLLHGLGFASVLADFGMPESAYATALISFNLGVELGQLAILVSGFFSLTIWFRNREHFHKYVTVPGSVAIGMVGLYWTWERISWSAF